MIHTGEIYRSNVLKPVYIILEPNRFNTKIMDLNSDKVFVVDTNLLVSILKRYYILKKNDEEYDN